MKNSISKNAFIILFVIFVLILYYVSRPELFDDSQIFQSQHVVNGQVNITILNAKSYSQGKTGYNYYIFTDKGRLLVDSRESFFDRDLYNKAKDNINKTCSATVNDKTFSKDWEISHLNC